MYIKRIDIFSILAILLSCIAGYALLHTGLPPTHDGEYHVVRFYEFDKVLHSGDLYPRWAPDFNKGYGIPLFNYVYPLPNYMAFIFHFLGFSFIDAFKLNMFLATLLGGFFFYLWTKEYWGSLGGVISSAFYTFSPYRFVDLYVRGSVGEVWALAFFPAFLWSVTIFAKKRDILHLILSSIFFACIIFSHNILALMFSIFAVSYVLFLAIRQKYKKNFFCNILFMFILGLGLSAIFWLPALFERNYVTGLQIYNVEKNFPELYQLLIPSWGTGFSETNLSNQTSFQIGIVNLLSIFLSSVVLIIYFLKKKFRVAALISFFITWFIVVFFLMLKISLPIWQLIPFMNYFQFPWRFLSLEILIASFLIGSIFKIWNSKILFVIFFLLPILFGIGYAKPAYYYQRQDEYYLTRSNFIDGTNSPGDLFNTIWFNKSLKKQTEKIKVEQGKVTSLSIHPTQYAFDVYSDFNTSITVNTAYFLGWKAMVDKKEIQIKPDRNGLITFFVQKGSYHIELQFRETPIRIFATGVSLASLFSVIVYLLLYYRGIILMYGKK